MSSTIDCQLTSKVHYTDRPEPQHNDLHSTNVLITTYESLTGTNLSLALYPVLLSLCFCLQFVSLGRAQAWISLCQSDGSVLKEAKATPKPLHSEPRNRQAMDTEQRRHGVLHCSSEAKFFRNNAVTMYMEACTILKKFELSVRENFCRIKHQPVFLLSYQLTVPFFPPPSLLLFWNSQSLEDLFLSPTPPLSLTVQLQIGFTCSWDSFQTINYHQCRVTVLQLS